jgi:hypothetical protein
MRTLLCAALLAAGLSTTAAHAGNLLDLAVVDRDTGQTLPTYSDSGRLYVAGAPGHRYSVRLSNRTGGRVLAVLSVDGVNAVSGQTANANQTGYVLDPFESTEVAGWRKNLDEIAQFNFTALPNSYAARTGRPQNVGVIGVAVFTEKARIREREKIAMDAAPPPATVQTPAPSEPMAAETQSRADSNAGAGAGAAKPAAAPKAESSLARSQERLGTGHGAREFAHVDETTFERASRRPAETVAIWYDSYTNLVEQGVIARPVVRTDPQPFPGNYVPDPPARR